ncbi:MAG: FtsX-like permease family protein, partial [Bryobacteraceae bacterium]
IATYFQIQPGVVWDWMSAIQGLGAGILTTLLFTLPPLLSIRRIPPALVLRREMPGSRPGWRAWWRQSRAAIASGGLILVGLGLLAAWFSGGATADSLRMGGYFAGGLAVSLAALAGVSWLLLWALRAFLRISPWKLAPSLRHGMANLYRPGNQAQAVLVALGLGVMFMLTIYLVQHSMLREIAQSAPPGMPNVFLIDIQAAERDSLSALLRAQPGVESPPEIAASVAVRLESVDGVAVRDLVLQGWGRRFLQTRSVTWSATKPDHAEILEGAWWRSPDPADAVLSVSEEAARALKVHPGSRLGFSAMGKTIAARVLAIHRPEAIRPGSMTEFVFNPNALVGLPATFYGAVRVKPAGVSALQRVVYDAFPTVSVINAADVLQIVQDVVDQIALVIRFISAFTILAGVVILASSVAGTRFRRVREVVILKTLGATRGRVARIFSVEFLILGAVAGVMGSLLAAGFSGLLLIRFFEGKFRVDFLPVVLAIVLTALVANAAGWLASFRILGQKPLEVLRDE